MVWIEAHPSVAQPPFSVEPLALTHNCKAFVCREPALTEYLTNGKALRDIANFSTVVYVCVDAQQVVWGYFTLNNHSIPRHDLLCSLYGPEWESPKNKTEKKLLGDLRRAFPYPEIGVTLLGRLAAHQLLKGTSFGKALMMEMLRKVWQAAQLTASRALVLDAKNDTLIRLYEEYGFVRMSESDRRMFLLMDTIRQLLDE